MRVTDLLQGTLDRRADEFGFKIFDGALPTAESLMYEDKGARAGTGLPGGATDRQLVKLTTLPSGATARPENMMAPMSAPPVMKRRRTRSGPER